MTALFALSLATGGATEWLARGLDGAESVGVDVALNGATIVGGNFQGALTLGSMALPDPGSHDAFVAKLAP